MTEKKRQYRLSHESFASIIEEFLSGPATVESLERASGMTARYINKLLRALRARKMLHIASYEPDPLGRMQVKVWALGPGKDARPKLKTKAEIQRDTRARRRSKDILQGTPFQGLPVMAANDGGSRKAA
jgi:hypothetical protein